MKDVKLVQIVTHKIAASRTNLYLHHLFQVLHGQSRHFASTFLPLVSPISSAIPTKILDLLLMCIEYMIF